MNTESLLVVGYSDCQNSNLEKLTSLNEDSSALAEVLPGHDIYSFNGGIPLSKEKPAATLRTSAGLFSKKNRESLFSLSFSGYGALVPRALNKGRIARGYFPVRQGARKELSHSYVTDEQRSMAGKEPAIFPRYLVREALACRFHLFLDLMLPTVSAAMIANGGEAPAYAKPNTRQASSMILKKGVPIAKTPGARTESSAIY